MGLDMYLAKQVYNENEDETVCYWRKANQIFNFFEKEFGEIENCQCYEVDRGMLKDLYDICKYISDEYEDVSNLWDFEQSEDFIQYCKNNLPTCEGFFFGSTEYNESYFITVSRTAEELAHILEDFDFENETLYFYAWW